MGSLLFKIKVGSGFSIGNLIRVEIIEKSGNWLSIRVSAPKEMKIERDDY